MFSDTHTHLTGTPFGDMVLEPREIQEVLKKSRDNGVALIVAASHDFTSSEKVVRIASEQEGVYAAIGIHPWVAAPADDETYKGFLALAKKPKVVAISEIGLDDKRSRASKEIQIQTLIQTLRLSRETGLPPIVHQQGFHKELMDLLHQEKPPTGIMHGFNGDSAELKEWLDLGYYVSIGRAVLTPDGQRLKAAVEQIPQDRLLTETDVVNRSKEGALEGQERVVQVAEVIASWRGTTAQEIGEATVRNLKRMLRI